MTDEQRKQLFDKLIGQMDRLPIWLLGLAGVGLVVALIVKMFRSDEVEVFWVKFRIDRRLREAIRDLRVEIERLAVWAPLFDLLSANMSDLLDDILARSTGIPDRLRACYSSLLAAADQAVGINKYHRVAILYPETLGSTTLVYARTLKYTSEDPDKKFDSNTYAGRAFASCKVQYCADVSKDPNLQITFGSYGYKSFVCVPIMAGGRSLGVLQMDARQTDAFSSDDIFVLQACAKYVAICSRVETLLQYKLEEVASSGQASTGTD